MPSEILEEPLSAFPDINLFLMCEGRLPKLGDPVPPWQYRGWLLSYVQLADAHPQIPGRWSHHLKTLEEGRLLTEPIPQICFEQCPPTDGRKMIERCLNLIARHESTWASFQQLVDWLAWGLAVSRELPKLREETHEALYRTFTLEPLLLHPHDYLGSILSDHRAGGWNPNAFFPTPHSIVELMVQMTLGGDASAVEGERDHRLKTVLDPCVGTGRMLLHASNFSYCLYGCDIDPMVAMITRINGALYAPWMAFPFPPSVLGVPLPPPPPAALPLPKEHQPQVETPIFRVDDRGQGLLF